MPTSVEHLFNNWANGVGPQFKKLLLWGSCSLLGNVDKYDMVFDNSLAKTYMQVLYR
jgi:hypothetical protein